MKPKRLPHRPTTLVTRAGKVIEFRSRLEAKWANYFDFAALNWSYEPLRFDIGKGITYTPDFFVEGIGYFEMKPDRKFMSESWDRIAKFVALGGADRVYLVSSASDPYTGRGFVTALHGVPLRELQFPMLEAYLILGGPERMKLAKNDPHMFIDSMRHLLWVGLNLPTPETPSLKDMLSA